MKSHSIGMVAFAGILVTISTLRAEDSGLMAPVRLAADGKVMDSGEQWGHSSPCMEDLDGDGLKDLIVGDFSGMFRIYHNSGTASSPSFTEAGFIQAGGEPAKVNIYCCIGSQARFLDLNADGQRDFIANSYDPGHCHFFRGMTDRKFASAITLQDKADTPVRSSPKQQQDYQSFGSFFSPIDWDADGDMDLLIGCFDGQLKLRVNEGSPKEYRFATENLIVDAGGEPLKVSAHCCPVVADWDGDTLWDLVIGADDGSVAWFRNSGAVGNPKFDKGQTLVTKHDGNGYDLVWWKEDEIRPGIRAQPEVVDYNHDGKLDLLVGDFSTVLAMKPDLNDSQKEQFRQLVATYRKTVKAYVAQTDKLRNDFRAKYPGELAYSEQADKEWSEAYRALNESPERKKLNEQEADYVRNIKPLLATTRGSGDQSHDLALAHGYVWLYLRK